MRIGQGYDAHEFIEGRPLIIGGETVPYAKGMKAHSDGDVLIHALCDALLGALALGDIGKHFPDSDPAYANIDSRKLLREVVALIDANSRSLANADITLIAQAPKFAGHITAMRHNLAEDLKVGVQQINIKATTTEGMGFTGRGEGIACMAVVLLISN